MEQNEDKNAIVKAFEQIGREGNALVDPAVEILSAMVQQLKKFVKNTVKYGPLIGGVKTFLEGRGVKMPLLVRKTDEFLDGVLDGAGRALNRFNPFSR